MDLYSFTVQPMMNVLIVLSNYLFDNFGLAIIVLTVVVNALMLRLTMRQLHATKAMQSLQPKLSELQKKYGKDKERLAKEQMRLYKESGISPAGCLVPMLVQMPIWIALFYSIRDLLPLAPEGLLKLSQHLYSWEAVYTMVPLNDTFLWLNLAVPDSFYLLPLLVGATMWVQQKMVTPTTTDPRQQTQSRLMLWMMPLMFAFITLQFPSGLALYWVTSSLMRIGIQYFVTGWGGLIPESARKQVVRDKKYKERIAQSAGTTVDIAEVAKEEAGSDYGTSGDKRQDSGGGHPARPRDIRRKPRGGGGHRPKRR